MLRILDQANEPSDLKRLSLGQLKRLSQEIREELVNTVFQTGGHLASNLGVVELTIAIHSVFDSPKDKIIWDVSHQCYVHKLLTGRKDRFCSIRQYGGLSGYTDPNESPHDVWGAGHASTSISAALGMAVARDLKREEGHVVAVIGDGAMTGGLAFEGLNNAGHLRTRLIVILNDNQMSISPNVGAIARYLNRLRADPRYFWAKSGVERQLLRTGWGRQILEALKHIKNSFKGLVIPTMIWEELGFTYLGPVDGHDLGLLLETLRLAKGITMRPVLVHVVTKKGKGYNPAEEDAVNYHGVAPNGTQKSTAPTYTKVFAQTLCKMARQDRRIVAITAAMPTGTGLVDFAHEFPDRFFDVGIAEEHAITFAAGLAAQGMRPVAAIYSTFLQRAYDQVLHDVCIQNLPVILAMDRAGIVGDDGRTHQGVFDLSYLRHIPNITIMAPKDENELQAMLWTALTVNGPVAIRYPRGVGVGVPLEEEPQPLPVGRGEVLRRGTDLAIIAIGNMVYPSLAAAEILAAEGIEAAVVNARFVKPLDEDLLIGIAKSFNRLVTVEENVLAGGFGSAVLELLHERGLNQVTVKRIGLPDEFIEHGPQEVLRAKYNLDAQGIARTVRDAFPELLLLPKEALFLEKPAAAALPAYEARGKLHVPNLGA